jgi:hypothetical protein
MEQKTTKIIDFCIKQCGPELRSTNMEKTGLIEVFKNIKAMGLTLGTLSTDMHIGIAKMMQTEYT